jgi:hypothetical protein
VKEENWGEKWGLEIENQKKGLVNWVYSFLVKILR